MTLIYGNSFFFVNHTQGYAPKVTLKYGNSLFLDDRQKRVYKAITELLSHQNYPDFSTGDNVSFSKVSLLQNVLYVISVKLTFENFCIKRVLSC